MVLWWPTRPSRTNTQKRCFIIGDWNAKVGHQEIPRVTGKFGLGVQNEAEQRLTEILQENSLIIASTLFQQHKRQLYTWTSPDDLYKNQTDYICKQRWRASIHSAETRPQADYGSYHELLISKFRLKMKKQTNKQTNKQTKKGKATRPFRYELKQIPYNYKMKVTNRFKGLDLIHRMPEEI